MPKIKAISYYVNKDHQFPHSSNTAEMLCRSSYWFTRDHLFMKFATFLFVFYSWKHHRIFQIPPAKFEKKTDPSSVMIVENGHSTSNDFSASQEFAVYLWHGLKIFDVSFDEETFLMDYRPFWLIASFMSYNTMVFRVILTLHY